MTMVPTTLSRPAASDSDDDDVAFASMDFNGVDFGEDLPRAVADDDNVKEVLHIPHVEHVSCSVVLDSADDNTTSRSCNNMDVSRPNRNDSIETQKQALESIYIDQNMHYELSDGDKSLSAIRQDLLLPNSQNKTHEKDHDDTEFNDAMNLLRQLKEGAYADILRSPIAHKMFGVQSEGGFGYVNLTGAPFMMEHIKLNALKYCSSNDVTNKSVYEKCVELELIGIASLNLFLQLNYTGPSMDRGLKPEEGKSHTQPLDGIHPHGMFEDLAAKEDEEVNVGSIITSALAPVSEDSTSSVTAELPSLLSLKERTTSNAFHNIVLSELASDGEWPFQVCRVPYFLLLARAILSMLANPTRPFRNWAKENEPKEDQSISTFSEISTLCNQFSFAANNLVGVALWNARAIVAHRRLITVRRDDDDGSACPTLWNETETMFQRCLNEFCEGKVLFDDNLRNSHVAASVMLEWGLAQHHFRRAGRGKSSFKKALVLIGLEVEVTGAEGKRTKYQQKSTAQYLVRAKPNVLEFMTPTNEEVSETDKDKNAHIEAQMIKHDDVSDDALLLEKIKFEAEQDNAHYNLSILDQSILLALCLDVKNDNPMDGLTGEQMGGFLARVLQQHDDWMVYATALLERAWLECERTHGRERAILQIQALADQHSNRLTLTQSTFKSVEEDSAPAQDRLRNLHGIVYPPRWDMMRDLAERYAKLGVVTSAAEIFEELELWDEVVECYRIAGKESKAEEVVRKRLAEKETPRMYAALGDLTKDPKCFERSLELSHGKFYDAHVALGKFYFDKGELRTALTHYLDALATKPLMPAVWFRVGTISMQLKEWDTALRAFTEVVQQQPDEGDAWANVAAVYMYRRNPEKAYPALQESLKQNRNNWRVWVSKLYTCIDLKKYDEAIQACSELLGLKARRNESEKVPMLEEKCIRAITGGSIRNYEEARSLGNEFSVDSSKRTLIRLRELLDRMQETMKSEPWIYEISAHLNAEMGWKKDVLNDLMKEYRVVQSENWEQDSIKMTKMVNLIKDIFQSHKEEGTRESFSKCKLLINGVKKKICDNSDYTGQSSTELLELDNMLKDLDECLAKFKSK